MNQCIMELENMNENGPPIRLTGAVGLHFDNVSMFMNMGRTMRRCWEIRAAISFMCREANRDMPLAMTTSISQYLRSLRSMLQELYI